MNAFDPAAHTPAEVAPAALTAGEMLRNAREAAGLAIEDVAQQLKLTPKQVIALEQNDFNGLPGRTFVRGFARNYARLLQLDQQMILDALPGANAGSGLDAPALHATSASIGEMPRDARTRVRWLSALLLVMIVAAIGYLGSQYYAGKRDVAGAPIGSRAPAAAPATAPAGPEPANASVSASDAGAPGPNSAPTETPAQAPAAAAAAAPLMFSVRGSSWIEVRDGTGKLILSRTLASGQSESVDGIQPFDVVVGNAPDVAVTFNGQPIDVAPFTRANIARFRLP